MLNHHRTLFMVAAVIAVVMLFGMWPRHHVAQAWEPAAPATLQWSPVGANGAPRNLRTYRAAVPGGWLVYDQEEKSAAGRQGYGKGVV
jgi:hypothetical protein